MVKSVHMVFKVVTWVHNTTIVVLVKKTEVFQELINNFLVLNSKTTQNLETTVLKTKTDIFAENHGLILAPPIICKPHQNHGF